MSIPRTNAGFGRKGLFFVFFIFAAPWYFFEKTVFKSHLNYSYKCFTQCSWLNTQQTSIRLLWKPTGSYRCGLDGTVDLNTTMAAPQDVFLLCLELYQNWRVFFFFPRKESKERHWWLVLMEKMVLFLLGMSLIYQLAPLTKRSRTIDPIGWS